jgi:hypothetical protein
LKYLNLDYYKNGDQRPYKNGAKSEKPKEKE